MFFRYVFTVFKKTPPISTYLLAFLVSQLPKKRARTSETGFFPLTVRYVPNRENDTRTALEYGGALIHAHSEFTDITYEELGITKMDFVGVPGFGGAMENWGLITFQ